MKYTAEQGRIQYSEKFMANENATGRSETFLGIFNLWNSAVWNQLSHLSLKNSENFIHLETTWAQEQVPVCVSMMSAWR